MVGAGPLMAELEAEAQMMVELTAGAPWKGELKVDAPWKDELKEDGPSTDEALAGSVGLRLGSCLGIRSLLQVQTMG